MFICFNIFLFRTSFGAPCFFHSRIYPKLVEFSLLVTFSRQVQYYSESLSLRSYACFCLLFSLNFSGIIHIKAELQVDQWSIYYWYIFFQFLMFLNIFFINPHVVTFQALICLGRLLLHCIFNVRLCTSQVKGFPFIRKLGFVISVNIRELKIPEHVCCLYIQVV